MAKRALIAFPRIASPAAWAGISSFRERFDPLAKLVPAHLTLVFPFEDGMSDLALQQHVQRIAEQERSFAITLQGITAHHGEYLFLNVKRGNDSLVHLHDTFYTGALAAHLDRRHTFFPHVTVGRIRPEELDRALEAAAELSGEIQATVETLSMCRIDADQIRLVFELELRLA